ncbi:MULTISPECIES: MDR family MFS transporter [unclassified Paenibacillus]|uniref:MDR family MFS transporter n=1 Tax=unclassified Paenibacillus TaxID=185978 RepID=UPI000955A984|nr:MULTISPECIES: MDR family MFS transporter [unclassified Paenibacillus]ASS67358.1 multidrug efflux MFS transporter [Paenibacillus sp. RUD330]SIQ80132.1 drug resistance transporter, EmrB/QacA subfamily [Paenibacillus sp. RU4X]SIR01521.1 drug resistance transporter, EmrB/QacA subfamily [Paenibacillus sp. RU4T]
MSVPLKSDAAETFSLRAVLPFILAVALGMFLVMLDGTIMNVAVPRLVEHFRSDLKTIQWAITAYTLALSAVIPLAGWFSDRFTAKRTFLFSIVFFLLGSLLCSFAGTPGQLVLFRVIQGLGGGMVAPIGMALSFQAAPPEKRGSIMGILGLPMLVAPILGPLLSGYFIEYVTWRWIFLVNLPVGAVALYMVYRFVPNKPRPAGRAVKLDKAGMILAPLAFVSLVYGVHEGGSNGWAGMPAVAPLIAGAAALLAFIVLELRLEQPLLELRAFRSGYFTRGAVLSWFNMMALFGSLLLITLYLQQVKGLSPLTSGLYVIPQAILSSIGLNAGGRLADKYGSRPVVVAGILSLAGSLSAFTRLTPDSSSAYLIAAVCFFGLGQGLSMMQINTYVLKSAPKGLLARITPITASAQQLFTSFSVTILTSSLTRQLQKAASPSDIAALSHAFAVTFRIPFGLSLAALALSFFLRNPKSN